MQLNKGFTVDAPIEEVWKALLDISSVAGCVPGARIVGQIGDDAYKVAMKVKLGPISMEYRGEIQVVEADEAAHRAVLRGRAKEARGQGTAEATAEMSLSRDGDGVRAEVSSDVKLSGRAAAMGQGVIGDVADQMIGQFADCLQARLSTPAAEGAPDGETAAVHARSGAGVDDAYDTAAAGSPTARTPQGADGDVRGSAVGDDVGAARDATGAGVGRAGAGNGAAQRGDAAVSHEAAVSGGAQSDPGARAVDRATAGQRMPAPAQPSAASSRDDGGAESSLDALSLARAVVAGRLQQPGGLAVGLAVVGLVGWLIGRRGRAVRGGLSVDDAIKIADALAARR